MSNQKLFAIKIGGQAGQGIKGAGLVLAKIATRSGLNVHTYTEYPSLIRGGHNVMQVIISNEVVATPLQRTDFLIALNQDTLDKHGGELIKTGGVIFDADKKMSTGMIKPEVNLYPIPLSKIASDTGGGELMINTVAVGATTALLGGETSILADLIAEEFADKGNEVVEINIKAAELGKAYVQEHFADKLLKIMAPVENPQKKMIVNGNEAVALGAIAGGVQFAAIYPMSPVSNILHVLAAHQEKYGYVFKQAEDELSAINMAVGAGFAGARSMTTTSGGGFCLMTEGYGLAAMAETPVVIVEGMRPGPATGLPTWSGQGDLQFALHAHQGDFPRIVLAAGDGLEAFQMTMQAFNLADKYQTPVILLIDKNICEDDQSYPVFDISGYQVNRGKFSRYYNSNYARYYAENDGISTRSIPGSGNFFIGSSYAHDEMGFDVEGIKDVNEQQAKRMKKLEVCRKEDMPAPQMFGPTDAEVTIVSWGSNKGNIMEALKNFNNVNFLYLTWMSPFADLAVKEILNKAKYVLDIETNTTGQLAQLIREKTGYEITDKLLKDDGRPIFPEEIADKLNMILNK
jgi:2-oxoglutarate/2-oxoacid ferredoxin oxidoreductase subunit alpha